MNTALLNGLKSSNSSTGSRSTISGIYGLQNWGTLLNTTQPAGHFSAFYNGVSRICTSRSNRANEPPALFFVVLLLSLPKVLNLAHIN